MDNRITTGRINIERSILTIRRQRVIIDADLARLYGVSTKQFNQQVKRNQKRFPSDFIFQLTLEEKTQLVTNCDQLQNLKHSSSLPYAFTEHGTVMAASVLNSQVAIETSILVVRAFIRARELIAEHLDLKIRLDELEKKMAKKFSENSKELMEIRFAIQQLRMPIENSDKRPLGFGHNKDK